MILKADPLLRILSAVLLVLFASAVALFLFHTSARFSQLTAPVPVDFGNASAPYSDALDPWLKGSLGYYLHDLPPPQPLPPYDRIIL